VHLKKAVLFVEREWLYFLGSKRQI